MSIKRVTKIMNVAKRCRGMTKEGLRCKRKLRGDGKYCYIHIVDICDQIYSKVYGTVYDKVYDNVYSTTAPPRPNVPFTSLLYTEHAACVDNRDINPVDVVGAEAPTPLEITHDEADILSTLDLNL